MNRYTSYLFRDVYFMIYYTHNEREILGNTKHIHGRLLIG